MPLVNANRILSRPAEKCKGFFRFPKSFSGPYSSTARPTLKNHRHRRPTATPAAWDRARL